MPDKRTIAKAREDKREGKSASTQAGEFIHDEIRKIRRGKHGVRSAKQAIAIGLSEARRAGVDLPPPRKGKTSESTRRSAEYAYEVGQHKRKVHRRPKVARAVEKVLEGEPRNTVSRRALSDQTKSAASRRTASERSAAAKKAVRTKGAAGRSAAARKAAKTRTKAKSSTGRSTGARKTARGRSSAVRSTGTRKTGRSRSGTGRSMTIRKTTRGKTSRSSSKK